MAGDLLFPLLLEFSLEFDEPWDPVRLFFLGVLPSFFLVLLLISFRVIELQEPIPHLSFFIALNSSLLEHSYNGSTGYGVQVRGYERPEKK